MLILTGQIAERLIKVENYARWHDIALTGCVVVGGPDVRFGQFESVTFLNCLFLYDGMEVEGREWLALMGWARVASPAKTTRRPS